VFNGLTEHALKKVQEIALAFSLVTATGCAVQPPQEPNISQAPQEITTSIDSELLTSGANKLDAGENLTPKEEATIINAVKHGEWENIVLNHSNIEKTESADKIILEAFKTGLKQRSPSINFILSNIDALKDNPGRQSVIDDIAKHYLNDVVRTCKSANEKDNPIKYELFKSALYEFADIDSESLSLRSSLFKDKPYAGDLANKIIEKDVPSVIQMHKHGLLDQNPHKEEILREKLYATVETSPGKFISRHSLFKDQPYHDELLEKAMTNVALQEPDHVIYNIESFLEKENGAKIIEAAFKQTPDNTLSYTNYKFLQDKTYKHEVINGAIDKLVQKNNHKELIANFPLIATENRKDIDAIADSINSDVTKYAIMAVRSFNEYHELPKNQRFALLSNLSPSQEFDLITKGRQEAFTSTYLNIVDDLANKLEKNGKNLTDILSESQKQEMATFLEAASAYNRIDTVIKLIPPQELEKTVKDIGEKAANAPELNYLVSMTEIMVSLKGNPQLRHSFESELKHQYENATSQEAKDRMGVAANIYAKSSDEISPDMKTFFSGMEHNQRYQVEKIVTIEQDKLTYKDGKNYQLMVFPSDDDDSKASFNHWKQEYKGKSGWKIEEKENHTHISNETGKTPVHIYANNPEKLDEGIAEIKNIVAAKQGGKQAEFQMFTGRGHSYHAETYLQLIDDKIKLVNLGSCGGAENVVKVKAKSPDAQVSATKETGKMAINDSMGFSQSQAIAQYSKITWKTEQEKLDKSPDQETANAYLLPHRNLPAIIIDKVQKLENTPENSPKVENIQGMSSASPIAYSAGNIKTTGIKLG